MTPLKKHYQVTMEHIRSNSNINNIVKGYLTFAILLFGIISLGFSYLDIFTHILILSFFGSATLLGFGIILTQFNRVDYIDLWKKSHEREVILKSKILLGLRYTLLYYVFALLLYYSYVSYEKLSMTVFRFEEIDILLVIVNVIAIHIVAVIGIMWIFSYFIKFIKYDSSKNMFLADGRSISIGMAIVFGIYAVLFILIVGYIELVNLGNTGIARILIVGLLAVQIVVFIIGSQTYKDKLRTRNDIAVF